MTEAYPLDRASDLAALLRAWPGTVGFLDADGLMTCLSCAQKDQRQDPEDFEAREVVLAVPDEHDDVCAGCRAPIPGDGGVLERVYDGVRRMDSSELARRLAGADTGDLGARVLPAGTEAEQRAAGRAWIAAAHAMLADRVIKQHNG